jgi:hypothetical protein
VTYRDRSRQLEYLKKYKKDRFIEIPKELKDDARLKAQISDLITMAMADLKFRIGKVSKPQSQEDKEPGRIKQSKPKKPRTRKAA